MLPKWLYETIRWLVSVVIPATSVFFATLAETWGWGLPTEAIVTTLSAAGLFLGAIFGISKVVNDSSNGGK